MRRSVEIGILLGLLTMSAIAPAASASTEVTIDLLIQPHAEVDGGARSGSAIITLSRAPRPPIVISNDGDFTLANGVSGGSGTSVDPFVIADWEINSAVTPGISISGTKSHFIVRNVTVSDLAAGGPNGIALTDVQNGTIRNATIFNVSEGISIDSTGPGPTRNVAVLDSYLHTMTSGVAITAESSGANVNNITVTGNIIRGGDEGVYFNVNFGGQANDNLVRGNTMTNMVVRPIRFSAWSDDPMRRNNISDNTLIGGSPAIWVYGGSQTDITANRVWSATGTGIQIEGVNVPTTDNRVAWNQVNDTGSYGIYLGGSSPPADSTNVTDNHVFNTASSGIYSVNPTGSWYLRNRVHEADSGIWLESNVGQIRDTRLRVDNNQVYNNRANGIYFSVCCDQARLNTIRGNAVWNNTGDGISVYGFSDGNISGNIVHRNTNGIYLSSGTTSHTLNNVVGWNDIHNNSMSGIYLEDPPADPALTTPNKLLRNMVHYNMVYGIKLSNATAISVEQNLAWGNHHGIHLESSSSNLVANNTANYNDVGIHLISRTPYPTNDNTVRDNEARWNSEHGIYLDVATPGTGGAAVSGNAVVFNRAYNNTMAGIYLYASSSNNISRNEVGGNNDGVYLNTGSNGITDSNTIGWNDIHDNPNYGIFMQRGTGDEMRLNTITRNTVVRSDYGLSMIGGDDNQITQNELAWNVNVGFYIGSSSDPSERNNISSNNVNNNTNLGGYSFEADMNNYSWNHFAKNGQEGFGFSPGSSGNTVYRNNFIDNNGNVSQAFDLSGGLNDWNLSAPVGGNFWSDHSYTCPDSPPDGFCDTPYIVSAVGPVLDMLPLTNQSPVPVVPESGLGGQLALLGLMLAAIAGIVVRRRIPRREP